ncbi:MAG: hypothetical protein VKK59_06740 [Vampirovibrionales bacterium]|nr:hypothetical protein [Vampirovibrionales bacterium]
MAAANNSFLTASQSALLRLLMSQQHNLTCSIEGLLHQASQAPPAHRIMGLVTLGSAMDPCFLRLDADGLKARPRQKSS